MTIDFLYLSTEMTTLDDKYFEVSNSSLDWYDLTTVATITKGNNGKLSIYSIIMPIIGFLIVFLNLSVVISSGLILKKGSQPRSTYLFLGNVALSDLTTALSILFGVFYPKEDRSQTTCAFQLGLIVSSTVVSIYSVGLIAADRYLYIIHGLQYQRWVYPTRARILILFTWILGCIVGFLPIMGWAGETYNGKKCWFITLVPPKLIITICIIAILPVIEVVILYSIILYHALRKVVQLRSAGKKTQTNDNDLRIFRGKTALNQNQTNDTNGDIEKSNNESIFNRYFKKNTTETQKEPSKSRAIKIVFLTTGSFVITWVPYFVASFIYVTCDPKVSPQKCKNLEFLIASPLAILGFCNSFLNPIIYAWWHRGFRDFVTKMFFKTKMKLTGKSNDFVLEKSSNSSKKTSSTFDGNENSEPPMVSIDLNAKD